MRSSFLRAWLKAPAIRPSVPVQPVGKRTEKSPSRNASIDASIRSERTAALSAATDFNLSDLPFFKVAEGGSLRERGRIVVSAMVHQRMCLKQRNIVVKREHEC